MSLPSETQVLLDLSLAIGDGTDLEPMLRRFMVVMLEKLDGTGVAVLQTEYAGQATWITPTPLVCTLPHSLPRHPAYGTFWEHWSLEKLEKALTGQPEGMPLITVQDQCAVHVFRLSQFGLLLFLREGAQPVLSDRIQLAFVPLAQKLATAARACLLESAMRRQTQRLELAAESAALGVWEWEVASGRLDWDARMLDLFGIERGEFQGQLNAWLQQIHPDDLAQTLERFEGALRADDRLAMEFRTKPVGGEHRHLRAHALIQRTPSGEPTRVVGVTQDVSKRKRAEAEMRQAQRDAEAANIAKSEFIANISHEIRTPMNGIIGMTELTLDTTLTPVQRDYLGIVKSSAETLLALVNDILDFSKINAGRMELESIPFSLPVMITEALKTLSMRARSKGLEFVVDLPPNLPVQSLGDPGRIRQVLVNLCDNAIKFTAKGEIRVALQATAKSDPARDEIRIAVTDTGIGIPDEKLEAVFEPFNQTDASITRQYGGTGLGLNICTQLVAMMGGQLRAESKLGQGSTFIVTLPLPRAERPDPVFIDPQTWKELRALIVDPHPVNRRTVCCWLEHWGFLTQEAEDAAGALEIARAEQSKGAAFDVLVLDSRGSDIDGFELANRLRQEGLAETRKVILLSSAGLPGDAQRCRELGIAAFLTKPATPLELRETLGHILGSDAHPPEAPLLTRHHLKEQRQLKILLVEDNLINQKLASTLLRKLGHEVTLAEDGQIAVELFAPMAFDLVFMDIQMPVMDGLSATRAIREKEAGLTRTPIIAMTAHAAESDRLRCLEAGMDEHLAKPLRPTVLEAMIARFLGDA